MLTYNSDLTFLKAAIDSVSNQFYPYWELCIADDGTQQHKILDYLRTLADPRIKATFLKKNSGISLATKAAYQLARGSFISFIDHDDVLPRDALLEAAKMLNTAKTDIVYSDEDKLNDRGQRCKPAFKSPWNPDLLLSYNYLCHLAVYRKSLIDRAGGIRSGFDGAQDYDLALRATEKAKKITHIPKVLYHWRMSKSSTALNPSIKHYAHINAQKALQEALRRRKIKGIVIPQQPAGCFRVKRHIVGSPSVSIIIPSRNIKLLNNCLNSINKTSYKNYEIIIINNNIDSIRNQLIEIKNKFDIINYNKKRFNFSEANNIAAAHSHSDYVLFLNDDTEIITPDWIEALLEHAQRKEVGCVGAKLLYPFNKIQHAGIEFVNNDFLHVYRYFPAEAYPTSFVRNCSAVTGACLMIKRNLFQKFGGFVTQLPLTYNDVDLCLRLRKAGYLNIYTPYASLYHYESKTRGRTYEPRSYAYMIKKWKRFAETNNYFNKNTLLEA